ncbi:MAG: RdgB/HAM1 family non-canonical purine NTP pyrophosphatase [Alphaproteobacteria bacterium]|nr:RdgB/HAM1 family non-canonical purine NTP pyrophosphatase [Alphaproteobacteria bacterium]
MDTIIFATHNAHKLEEVGKILSPLNIKVLGGDDCNLPEVEETGETFEENALIKAIAGVKALGKPVLAEDAGLSIEGLGGAPGVYSARFASAHGGYPETFKYINEQLSSGKSRDAFYTSIMVLAYSEDEYYVFKGYMHGKIALEPSGTNGFGYDPIFIPNGFNTTLGHIEEIVKNKISHRAQSIKQVYEFLKNKKGE